MHNDLFSVWAYYRVDQKAAVKTQQKVRCWLAIGAQGSVKLTESKDWLFCSCNRKTSAAQISERYKCITVEACDGAHADPCLPPKVPKIAT